MKKIHRGMWADRLEIGDELPVGGSVFSDELIIKLQLDFDSFNGQLDNYHSPQKLSELYAQNRQSVTDWLTKGWSKVDPYLFFVANTVQRKVQTLMDVKPESPASDLERIARFKDNKAKLTDLRGVAMCAEQASLGQYLLQNVLQEGYTSAYMSGVETNSPTSDLRNHSFIVIKDPKTRTYIFDIERPRSGNNLPRILETDALFNYELVGQTKTLLVGATEVLQCGRLYFGVGNPMLEQEPTVLDKKSQQ